MTLGGVILAGGRSRRMGTPKAALDWYGTPLVAHVAERVAAATRGTVLVVRAPGQALPPLPAGVAVTEDAAPGRGPLQGLAAGLAALPAELAFVCATDQPFAHAVLPALLAELTDSDDAVAYAGQPLGALYRTRLAGLAEERLRGGDASLHGLLTACAARVLDAAQTPAALRGLDTPGDYAQALRSSAGRGC